MPGRETPKLLQSSLLCGWLDPFTGMFRWIPVVHSIYSSQTVGASPDDVWIHESLTALKDLKMHAIFLLLKCEQGD